MNNLKFYALVSDWNSKSITTTNVLNSSMLEYLKKYLDKEYTNFEDFKKKVERELWYYYHSRAEYEMIYSDLSNHFEEKVSVYDQVIPNLDLIANMIFEEYNKNKRKKLEKNEK